MALNPPSFRFPFDLSDPEQVKLAIRQAFNGLTNHEQAFAHLGNVVNTIQGTVQTFAGGTVVNNNTTIINGGTTHAEPLTDGNSNFIFAGGDVICVTGVTN